MNQPPDFTGATTIGAVAAPDNVRAIVRQWNRSCGVGSVPHVANCKTVTRPNGLASIVEIAMLGGRGVWHPLGLGAVDDHTVHEALKALYRHLTGSEPPFVFKASGA